LKLKDKRGRDDLPLGDGWAYWVPEQGYQDHIMEYGHQQEVRLALIIAALSLTTRTLAKSL
jgi:hypothetical protein